MLHVLSPVRQVPGAVQAGQSLREIHPGSLQERQRRLLQAQEQPPAGGVGALDGVARLLATVVLEGSHRWGGLLLKLPVSNLSSGHQSPPQCPP